MPRLPAIEPLIAVNVHSCDERWTAPDPLLSFELSKSGLSTLKSGSVAYSRLQARQGSAIYRDVAVKCQTGH